MARTEICHVNAEELEHALLSPKCPPKPGDLEPREIQSNEIRIKRDHGNNIKILSPISVFPKPLGLAYLNFKTHYSSHMFADGTRVEAGSLLVASLLRHYFPKPKFEFWRLVYQPKSLIQSVPVEGTVYWVVTMSDGASQVNDTSLGGAPTSDKLIDDIARQDSVFRQEDSSGRSSLVLLVAIVTLADFLTRPERSTPSKMKISSLATTANGAIAVDDAQARQGNVLVVGGSTRPLSPTFEFYNFDVDSEEKTYLVPWSGQLALQPEGLGTSIFSLATEEAGKVDQMFRAIASRSPDNYALNSEFPALSFAPQTPERRAPTPLAEKTTNTPGAMSDQYLRSLKINKVGKLQGVGGRFLPAYKEKEAKRQAKARGITFAKPEFRVRSWAERKQAKENRLSMTPEVTPEEEQ